MISNDTPRVALVHDWLNQAGGAEVVLEVLQEAWPTAPIFSSMADPTRVPAAADWDLQLSWMDRLPGIHRRHQPYLPLYPLAWQGCDLSDFDLIISNKSGFCHGLISGAAKHLCYCLTPTRFVWQPDDYLAFENVPPGGRLALRALLPWLRRWDFEAAQRVDRFVAISSTVQERIRRYYKRNSEILFPPARLSRFKPIQENDGRETPFYLILARLVPYKRIDLAIEAFNQLGRRLVVVGEGRDRERLESMAGETIEFRGRLEADEVDRCLAQAEALIWPGVEDYGLAPIEAMASGRPVIARRAGGVLDTVLEGETGLFFDESRAESLAEAVIAADDIIWSPERIHQHAQGFGMDAFHAGLQQIIQNLLSSTEEENVDSR